MHHVADQVAKLPIGIRYQLNLKGKTESNLRGLETVDNSRADALTGEYRMSWLIPLIDQDRQMRAEIRRLERLIDELLDKHGHHPPG